jgi:hypothetical protein
MAKPADAPELPFIPVCYPAVRARSCELHPRGPAYCWKEHLRTLSRLCKAYIASDPKSRTPWLLVPEAERLYVTALATVPVEMLILDIQRERIVRANLPAWPLWWADPHDSHLQPAEPAIVRDDRRRTI